MQSKPILKLGRVIALCVILTSLSPGCLVRSGAAPVITTLNLIKANIDTGASSATPSSKNNFSKCYGDPWKENDDYAMLYNGDTKVEEATCLCGKQLDSSSNDIEQKFTLGLTQTIVVKTIITTNIPAH